MDIQKIISEVNYKAVRSSGLGTKCKQSLSSCLDFDVEHSQGLSEEEKELLKVNLSSRLTTDLFDFKL
jgi:ribosome-associated protein